MLSIFIRLYLAAADSAPPPAPDKARKALVVARQGDEWSETAAQQLVQTGSQNVAVVAAAKAFERVRNFDDIAVVPTFEDDDEHRPKVMRDLIQRQLLSARGIANFDRAEHVIVDAVRLARAMPASDPERRSATLRQAIHEFLSLLVARKPSDRRIDPLLTELVLREKGAALTTDNKQLEQLYREKAAKLRTGPTYSVTLSVVPVVDKWRVWIDGGEGIDCESTAEMKRMGAGNKTLMLAPGIHEIIVRADKPLVYNNIFLSAATDTPLYQHPLWVRAVAVGNWSDTVSFYLSEETHVAVTPTGAIVREEASLSHDMAAQIAAIADTDLVWLIERTDPAAAKAVIRALPVEGPPIASHIEWGRAAGDENHVPLELLTLAADVAATQRMPQALLNFSVERLPSGDFAFRPYAGEWRAPGPWYTKWWVWTIAGAAVTGAVVAGVVASGPARTP